MRTPSHRILTGAVAGAFILAQSVAFAAGGFKPISQDQAEAIQGGQSKEEVIAALGQPEYVQNLRVVDGGQSLVYEVMPEANIAGQESKLYVDIDAAGQVVNSTIMVTDDTE
ncbi:MAG: hypothetical protein REI94_07745 [Moraxellaceae bacterium]|nr:hypothetical protein [Moraxellaceae bacterium]